jgi:glycine betaine/proline transport system substrate-binding protein
VKEKWPGAYAAIKAFRVTNDEMGEMIGRVDLEGQSVEVVVADWMAKNEDRWKAWIGR